MTATYRHLTDTPPELSVASRHNVALVALDPIDNAVVGIGALVRALETLEARVACDAQRDAVLGSKLLELGQHARRDARNSCGERGPSRGTNS